MPQYTTAISDLVLAGTALNLVINFAYAKEYLICVGVGMQTIAAMLGVLVFGLSRPPTMIIRIHGFMSWIAAVVGTALMSGGFQKIMGMDILVNVTIGFATSFFVSSFLLPEDMVVLLTKSVSGFSMLSLLIVSSMNKRVYLTCGSVWYIIGGAIVGARGAWFQVPRVDIMHYCLVIGNCLFFCERLPAITKWF